MAPLNTSWHYGTEPSFPNSEATPLGYRISGTASEAGDRAFVAKRSFASARQRSCPANPARVTISTGCPHIVFCRSAGVRITGTVGSYSGLPACWPGLPTFLET
jgi:hypothetical protein